MQGEFEMSMMGELSFFLGLQIKQRKDDTFINQAKYIKEKLKKFGLENVKSQATSMSSSSKLDKDEGGKCVDSKLYRSMIRGYRFGRLERSLGSFGKITSLVEARRQEDQGINFCSRLCWMDFGEPCVFSSLDFCISGLEYRYDLVVPVPRFLVGIRVSVLLGEYRYSLKLVPVPFESRIGTARPNWALYRYSGAYRYPNSSLEF
ncbi:hypothetical protein V6N11_079794 [Hibiscus sabdariffa]|uniref:Reverse transcriptase Ty1/copia-type domain-containing protein n=1 Tax=Hibiscus sabdariffa TaxID=183260 RepID=A0ABR2RWW3_9ROSI